MDDIQLSVAPVEISLLPFPLPCEAEVQGATFDTLFKFISSRIVFKSLLLLGSGGLKDTVLQVCVALCSFS